MKVKCKYNDPNKVPNGISQNFDYGLELNKEYLVMGIYGDGHQLFYFLDEGGRPNLFPIDLFEITNNQLSDKWFFKILSQSEKDSAFKEFVFGYFEFCFDHDHYEQVIEREQSALELYFKRKIELEKYYEDLEFLK